VVDFYKTIFCVIALLFSSLLFANQTTSQEIRHTSSEADSIQREYEVRVRALKRRYKAFIDHEERLANEELKRQKGIEKHKKTRELATEREEKARLKFLTNRKPPPDTTEAELKYLANLEKRDARLEKLRMRFVDRRDRLRVMLDKEVGIPPEKEVGL
jgi:hypothetical protein